MPRRAPSTRVMGRGRARCAAFCLPTMTAQALARSCGGRTERLDVFVVPVILTCKTVNWLSLGLGYPLKPKRLGEACNGVLRGATGSGLLHLSAELVPVLKCVAMKIIAAGAYLSSAGVHFCLKRVAVAIPVPGRQRQAQKSPPACARAVGCRGCAGAARGCSQRAVTANR